MLQVCFNLSQLPSPDKGLVKIKSNIYFINFLKILHHIKSIFTFVQAVQCTHTTQWSAVWCTDHNALNKFVSAYVWNMILTGNYICFLTVFNHTFYYLHFGSNNSFQLSVDDFIWASERVGRVGWGWNDEYMYNLSKPLIFIVQKLQ